MKLYYEDKEIKVQDVIEYNGIKYLLVKNEDDTTNESGIILKVIENSLYEIEDKEEFKEVYEKFLTRVYEITQEEIDEMLADFE